MYARDYRHRARQSLAGNWPISIGVGILAYILGGILVGSSFLPGIEIKIESQDFKSISELLKFMWRVGGITLGFSSALGLMQFIIGGVIQLGYSQFLLKQHDSQDPQAGDLFSKFEHFGAGFCQAFLRSLYTFLWSLLFIIPGIVASYSYAMTPFIMAENPEMSASEAISASKEMMHGHRWALFCLDFSFIGWSFLCALTANIGYIALNPYQNAAHAAFYRNLKQTDAVS